MHPVIDKLLSNRPVHRDLGLLALRLGVGSSMLLFHGYSKVTADAETWERIGSSMEYLGISLAPRFWGFMAAFSEFGGSILLMLGVLFRPAATLLAFTMLVAATRHLNLPAGEPGAGWKGASHAIELLSVYLCLLLTGSGGYTLPALWKGRRRSS